MLLADGGPGVASAASPRTEEILAKVDQILTALGSIQGGNPTLRWDQNLPAAQWFVILPAFNNEAVLDKNTGLVWEKSPATTPITWIGARATCIRKNIGGQQGWRLSSIPELASLIDPSVPSPGLTLPPGHPFLNVQSAPYWSASLTTENPTLAWEVHFDIGPVAFGNFIDNRHVWCVRGGMNADQY